VLHQSNRLHYHRPTLDLVVLAHTPPLTFLLLAGRCGGDSLLMVYGLSILHLSLVSLQQPLLEPLETEKPLRERISINSPFTPLPSTTTYQSASRLPAIILRAVALPTGEVFHLPTPLAHLLGQETLRDVELLGGGGSASPISGPDLLMLHLLVCLLVGHRVLDAGRAVDG